MLLQEYQRYALECTFFIDRTPKDAPKIPLESFLLNLQNHVDKELAFYSSMGGRKTFIIKKMKYDDQKIILLVQFADKDATDPSFTNTNTGITRTVNKQEGEGISVSAHIVISRKPQSDAKNLVHDAILEEVPGISKTNLKSALNAILNECTDFEFQHPDKPNNLKCRPLIELDYNAGEKLEDLVKNGTVTGFVATKFTALQRLDEDGDLIPTTERIEIKAKKSRGQKAIDLITKARDAVIGKEYTRLMIRYEGDDKRSKTFEVSTREQNIAEKFFAKSYKIDLNDKVEQCQSTIHEELVGKMLLLLNKMAKQA